jgi:hypothetical protein
MHVQLSAEDDSPAIGDYYEVLVTQTSGGALNAGTDCWFTALHSWSLFFLAVSSSLLVKTTAFFGLLAIARIW